MKEGINRPQQSQEEPKNDDIAEANLQEAKTGLKVDLTKLITPPKIDPETLNKLKPREIDLMKLVRIGLPTKEIAYQLHVSEGTVKGTLSVLLSKLRLYKFDVVNLEFFSILEKQIDNPQAPTVHLSSRDRQVLIGIQRGLSNKQIADVMQIKESEIRDYVRNMSIRTFHCNGRFRMLLEAARKGVFTLNDVEDITEI
jgi:DNA-binding NarL/FixJ family response regulator